MRTAPRFDFEKTIFTAATDRLSNSHNSSDNSFSMTGFDALISVLRDRKTVPHRDNTPAEKPEVNEYLQWVGSLVELAAELSISEPKFPNRLNLTQAEPGRSSEEMR